MNLIVVAQPLNDRSGPLGHRRHGSAAVSGCHERFDIGTGLQLRLRVC